MEPLSKRTGGTRYRAVRTGSPQSMEKGLSAPKKELSPSKKLLHRLAQLPKMRDPSQRRAGRNIAVFFLLMLVLTLIARGTAGVAVAQVETASPSADEIIEMIRENGTVSAGDIAGVKAPEGLTVDEVPVLAGAAVKAGDQLVKFTPEQVQEELLRAQAKEKEHRQKLAELGQTAPNDNSSLVNAQNALAWAQQDYSDTQNNNAKSIAAAQKALDTANETLTAAENALTALEQRPAATPVPLPESSADPETVPTAEPAPDHSQAELDAARQAVAQAKSEADSARAALEETKTSAQEAIKNAQRAITNAEQSLASAQASAALTAQTEKNTKDQNAISAETVALDIQQQEEIIAALQKIADTGGWLIAEKDGVLRTVPNAGDKTDGGILVTYADTGGGFEAEITVSKKAAQALTAGSKADIVDSNASIYFSEPLQGTIKAISQPDEEEKVKIIISLPEKDWKIGQSVEVRLVTKQETYQSCVPLSAVRSDSAGNFVLITEERATILGQESVLVRIPVTVLSQGESACAIEGALSMDASIVTSSTKPVADGDRVRVMQG